VTFADGLIGVVLDGRYQLDAVLGEGGMGSVFRATHLAMDRKVAVKLLKPHLTNDEVALKRFAAEARRTMRVDSPHAVKVLDFGVTEHRDYYMVLEYLDGRTVQRELEVDGPFAPMRVVHVARQALAALGAAHASGLVHRDVKPDNLLLMRQGDDPDFCKVLDFGVAKLMEGAAPSTRSQLGLTQQGMVFGTPEFMSPEQACGLPLDARSDLYALAATMFAMLTGCGLFTGNSAIEWLTHHARTPPPHLGQVNAALAEHAALDALLQKCLAKRPEQRPASAADLDARLADIERAMRGGPAAIAASAPSPSKLVKTVFSPSSYVEALPTDGAATSSERPARLMRPPTTEPGEALGAAKRPPLALLAVFAALAVAGVVIAMIAVGDKAQPAAALVASEASPGAGSAVAARAETETETGSSTSTSTLPSPSMSTTTTTPTTTTTTPTTTAAPPRPPVVLPPHPQMPPSAHSARPEVDAHLTAAKDAQAANNRLGELAHAQAALKLDPSNLQAAYLMGDALLATGDTDRGCQILGNIKRFPLALQRMRVAGCPD
jgi:serine/threonine-protein kinase